MERGWIAIYISCHTSQVVKKDLSKLDLSNLGTCPHPYHNITFRLRHGERG